MRLLSTVLLLALASPGLSTPTDSEPLTLERIMAAPDWIGSPVEDAGWQWNSKEVAYSLKREATLLRDWYRRRIDAEVPPQRIADNARADLDVRNVRYDTQRRRMVMVRNDDIFLRDLQNGRLFPITRSNAVDADPAFTHGGDVIWRVGHTWYLWSTVDHSIREIVSIRADRAPDATTPPDDLARQQLRILETLRERREQREAAQRHREALRQADISRAPAPFYLGSDLTIVGSTLSPDLSHLLVISQAKNAAPGQVGIMQEYLAESGYETIHNVRTRVGRNPPPAQRLWLIDLTTRAIKPISFDNLPGIDTDPLATLRHKANLPALQGARPVRIGDDDNTNVHWSRDGQRVALSLRSIDNKDRWIATLDLQQARLQPRHRLHDGAWVNWNFNDFGWLPDNRTLWWLSEESGFSHLYTLAEGGRAQQRTSGHWEVSTPIADHDGQHFFFLCNRDWPGKYEVCRLELASGTLTEITALAGVEAFQLSPDGTQLLVHYSRSYLPTQLAVVPLAAPSMVNILTDTRTSAFKAQIWIEPEFVRIPSKHGAGAIWGKFYGPAEPEPGRHYPIVLFAHGAGYLQNVSQRYPAYFREQMFHNFLVQHGYVVLDIDFRASQGYGRDWRTAVYRNLGQAEIEDYLDGIDWLVEQRQGDRERVGIYGGSYGGFLTFMALFRKPGTFKAGAALRPVVDWTQYNHWYTSKLLNTPDLDPEAYRRSSPIEYVEHFQDHLLIAHGMIDDNVFFRDSIMLTQRLLELQKDNWELAAYPLERHGFVHADSWLDEYKRIFRLFETTLKP